MVQTAPPPSINVLNANPVRVFNVDFQLPKKNSVLTKKGLKKRFVMVI